MDEVDGSWNCGIQMAPIELLFVEYDTMWYMFWFLVLYSITHHCISITRYPMNILQPAPFKTPDIPRIGDYTDRRTEFIERRVYMYIGRMFQNFVQE